MTEYNFEINYFKMKFGKDKYSFVFFVKNMDRFITEKQMHDEKEFIEKFFLDNLIKEKWIPISRDNDIISSHDKNSIEKQTIKSNYIDTIYDNANLESKIAIAYKEYNKDEFKILKKNINITDKFKVFYRKYNLYSFHELNINRSIIIDSYINNIIYLNFSIKYDIFYFILENNNALEDELDCNSNNLKYIFYGKLNKLENKFKEYTNFRLEKKFCLNYQNIVEYVIIDVNKSEESSIIKIIDSFSCVESNNNNIKNAIIMCMELPEQNKLENIRSNVGKILIYDNNKPELSVQSTSTSVKDSKRVPIKDPTTKRELYTETILEKFDESKFPMKQSFEKTSISIIVVLDYNSIWYPLNRNVFLWNDDNGLITGFLEKRNSWKNSPSSIIFDSEEPEKLSVDDSVFITYYVDEISNIQYEYEPCKILRFSDFTIDVQLENKTIINNLPRNTIKKNLSIMYTYDIVTEKAKREFCNFLIAFGLFNSSTNPFIFKENNYSLEELLKDLNYKSNGTTQESLYKRAGYNEEAIIVENDSGKNWIELLKMKFKFDPEYNWWYKSPLDFTEYLKLQNINIKENPESLKKIKNKIELNDIYLNSISFLKNRNIKANILDLKEYFDKLLSEDFDTLDTLKFTEEVSRNLSILQDIKDDTQIGIYLETIFPNDKDNNFSQSQINYNHILKNLWFSFFYELENTYYSVSIPIDYLQDKKETKLKKKINQILMKNPKFCYNMKAIMVQLLKNNISYDNFADDLMIQSWIYNPEFRNKSNLVENIPDSSYDCQNRRRYILENIWNIFINKEIIYNKKLTEIEEYQIKYTVYPLFLCIKINRLLKDLKLYGAYTIEFYVNQVFAKSENRGIHINMDKLLKCQLCLQKFIENKMKIIENLIETDRILQQYFSNNYINLRNIDDFKVIQYDPAKFYDCLSKFIETYGKEWKEPFVKFTTKKGSLQYFDAFFIKNNLNLNKYSKVYELITHITSLLRCKYINSVTLPDLIKVVKDNQINPCINTIARVGGRVDSTLPRFHWLPNTEKTIWGRWIRRCFQARDGYTMITADWSAQELLTMGLVSNNLKFIQSLNSGDLHAASALLMYNQKVISYKLEEDNKLVLTLDEFDCGSEKDIYIFYYENDKFNFIKSEYIEVNDKILTINSSDILIEKLRNKNDLFIISKKQRAKAKVLNFGLMYGLGYTSVREMTQLDIEEVNKMIEKWWNAFSGIKDFIRDQYKAAIINGYINTHNNRRYLLPEFLLYKQRIYNKEYIGNKGLMKEGIVRYINSGTAADWLKRSMILINNQFKESTPEIDCHILGTLHDEIIFEVKSEQVEQAKKIIENVMKKEAIPEFQDTSPPINVEISLDICPWWDNCSEDDASEYTSDKDVISLTDINELCSNLESEDRIELLKKISSVTSIKLEEDEEDEGISEIFR